MFGWAKPVPVNWNNLHHPRRDMALVAVAGPMANLIMALLWAAIAKLTLLSQASSPLLQNIQSFIKLAGIFGVQINAVLLILNLIPIPPLDGSRIISAILPPPLARKYDLIEPYGIWILLGLIFIFSKALLIPVIALSNLIFRLFGLDVSL
jgi:Zn-dependent protease